MKSSSASSSTMAAKNMYSAPVKPVSCGNSTAQTGKYIGHKEMVFQNVYDSIDPKTGEPHYRNDIVEQRMNEWVPGCPSTEGGHNWQAMSYYAPGNRIVAPLSQTCLDLAGANR